MHQLGQSFGLRDMCHEMHCSHVLRDNLPAYAYGGAAICLRCCIRCCALKATTAENKAHLQQRAVGSKVHLAKLTRLLASL